MSFDIFWDKLDKQLTQKFQDIINEQFRTTNNKPSFIGDIEISEFDFGTIPPSIEIIDVTDPFQEFYLPDNAVVDVDVRSDSTESRIVGENGSGVEMGIRNESGGMRVGVARENVANSGRRMLHKTSSSTFPRSSPLYHNNKTSPFTSTPITPTTPTTPTSLSSSSIISDASADWQRLREQARNSEIPLHLKDYNHQVDDQSLNSEEEVPLKQDTDAQIHIAISYKGNMKMVISTELYMNYPSLMFMSLPVRLTVTGFEFSGNYLIIYKF
jgi:mitochondrial distribution and morphology protein 12